MARKRKEDAGRGVPPWIITFSDMMSLLLTFFIMLVALSSLDNRKVKEAISSLHGAFGVMQTSQYSPRDKPIPSRAVAMDASKRKPEGKLVKSQMEGVARALIQEVDQLKAREAVDVEVLEDGLHLRLKNDVLFAPGSADLVPEGLRLLDSLAKQLEPYSNVIEIQGHSDSTRTTSGRFPTNWHLSFARAYAVMQHYVVERGMERSRFKLAALADTQPLADNDTEAGRARNRRVELVLRAAEEDLAMFDNPMFKPLLPMKDIQIEPYPY
ncbi:flagellar motor protein MotB [bacterium]|nr:flagellar motor protein MotB [bacterium]